MKLSNKAISLLKTDTKVRMQFATALGITESSLMIGIKRGSSSLTKYAGVQILKDAGLTEEEILETEGATN